jgi:hypothetical protein
VIIERAATKLRLDALVIQQGRLVEQNKPLSKEDMLAMIKYGAEEIFANKEGYEFRIVLTVCVCVFMYVGVVVLFVPVSNFPILKFSFSRTYTDEDIDRILQRGEQRTEEMNQKCIENANALWKLFSTEGKSVYHWEGKDWSLEAQKKLAKKILEVPKRERKRA